MRRHLFTAALTGMFGLLMLASDASACHKRKACHAPAPCGPCVAPAPCPEPCPPPTACAPKKKHKLFACFHHKKKAACPQPVCAAPPCYGPPVWGSGQAPAGQM